MPQELRTTSLSEAAYLHCVGFHDYVMEMVSDGGEQARWVFFSVDGIHDRRRDYRRGRARVEPQAFFSALTHVRKRLYEFLENGH